MRLDELEKSIFESSPLTDWREIRRTVRVRHVPRQHGPGTNYTSLDTMLWDVRVQLAWGEVQDVELPWLAREIRAFPHRPKSSKGHFVDLLLEERLVASYVFLALVTADGHSMTLPAPYQDREGNWSIAESSLRAVHWLTGRLNGKTVDKSDWTGWVDIFMAGYKLRAARGV